MDRTFDALSDAGLPVDDARDFVDDLDRAVAAAIRTGSPWVGLLRLLIDQADDVLDDVVDAAGEVAKLLQRDPSAIRERARRARARGKDERAARLRERAYAIEERRGLPHPGES